MTLNEPVYKKVKCSTTSSLVADSPALAAGQAMSCVSGVQDVLVCIYRCQSCRLKEDSSCVGPHRVGRAVPSSISFCF